MSKKLIRIVIPGLILLNGLWLTAFGQDYNNEILTMFTRGSVEFPEGEITVEIGEIEFQSPEIAEIIAEHTGETMTIAFPDYKREDSIFVSPKDPNLRVKQMELDLIYKIYLSDPAKRNTLNQELEQYDLVTHSLGLVEKARDWKVAAII